MPSSGLATSVVGAYLVPVPERIQRRLEHLAEGVGVQHNVRVIGQRLADVIKVAQVPKPAFAQSLPPETRTAVTHQLLDNQELVGTRAPLLAP